jgi:hypothetical protein
MPHTRFYEYKEMFRVETKQESIIDMTKPSAGRIYDYLLGGRHNFEIDRQAADHIITLMPFLTKAVRLQRWCLQDLAVELSKTRHFDVIIDFASGLPTNDHIHNHVTPGTRVIYSDWDPVTVRHAHNILRDTPDVYYFEADARYPDQLLDSPQVTEILDGQRDIALIYWGVSSFLNDDELAHAARVLHDWTGPKSCLAFNAQAADLGINEQDPARIQVRQTYERMGTSTYLRSLEQYIHLLHPWQADEQGFISLLQWHQIDLTMMSQEDYQAWGPGGGGYGAYLHKDS